MVSIVTYTRRIVSDATCARRQVLLWCPRSSRKRSLLKMQLSTPDTERFCKFPPRKLATLQRKTILPFNLRRMDAYARRSYNFSEIFFLLLQDTLTKEWQLTLKEAAWAIRHNNKAFFENWELVARDGWLVRKKVSDGVFHYFLSDQAGVRELITAPAPADKSFPWSKEALEAAAKMRADGASEGEIARFLLATESERLDSWYSAKERTIWIMPLNPVFLLMETTAADMKVDLPAREDREAWFRGSDA